MLDYNLYIYSCNKYLNFEKIASEMRQFYEDCKDYFARVVFSVQKFSTSKKKFSSIGRILTIGRPTGS